MRESMKVPITLDIITQRIEARSTEKPFKEKSMKTIIAARKERIEEMLKEIEELVSVAEHAPSERKSSAKKMIDYKKALLKNYATMFDLMRYMLNRAEARMLYLFDS